MEHADPTSKHDNGQKTCPKHVEIYSQNKFEKLVHLICFIVRIQIQPSSTKYIVLNLLCIGLGLIACIYLTCNNHSGST